MMSEKPIVVGAGELLWDVYPDRRRPGGAPANVAFHAQQLGLAGVVFSRVGQDALGRELCDHLEVNNVPTTYVQRDPDHRTGEVTVDVRSPDPVAGVATAAMIGPSYMATRDEKDSTRARANILRELLTRYLTENLPTGGR
mgnify:CR=1 FL=1